MFTLTKEDLTKQLKELGETVSFDEQLCVVEAACGSFSCFHRFKGLYVGAGDVISVFLSEDEEEFVDIHLRDGDTYSRSDVVLDMALGEEKQIEYTIRSECGDAEVVLRFNVLF